MRALKSSKKRFSVEKIKHISDLWEKIKFLWNKYVEINPYIGLGGCGAALVENLEEGELPEDMNHVLTLPKLDDDFSFGLLMSLQESTTERGADDWLFVMIENLSKIQNDFLSDLIKKGSESEAYLSDLSIFDVISPFSHSELNEMYVGSDIESFFKQESTRINDLFASRYLGSGEFDFSGAWRDVKRDYLSNKPFIQGVAELRNVFRFRNIKEEDEEEDMIEGVDSRRENLIKMEERLPEEWKNEMSPDLYLVLKRSFHDLDRTGLVAALDGLYYLSDHAVNLRNESENLPSNPISWTILKLNKTDEVEEEKKEGGSGGRRRRGGRGGRGGLMDFSSNKEDIKERRRKKKEVKKPKEELIDEEVGELGEDEMNSLLNSIHITEHKIPSESARKFLCTLNIADILGISEYLLNLISTDAWKFAHYPLFMKQEPNISLLENIKLQLEDEGRDAEEVVEAIEEIEDVVDKYFNSWDISYAEESLKTNLEYVVGEGNVVVNALGDKLTIEHLMSILIFLNNMKSSFQPSQRREEEKKGVWILGGAISDMIFLVESRSESIEKNLRISRNIFNINKEEIDIEEDILENGETRKVYSEAEVKNTHYDIDIDETYSEEVSENITSQSSLLSEVNIAIFEEESGGDKTQSYFEFNRDHLQIEEDVFSRMQLISDWIRKTSPNDWCCGEHLVVQRVVEIANSILVKDPNQIGDVFDEILDTISDEGKVILLTHYRVILQQRLLTVSDSSETLELQYLTIGIMQQEYALITESRNPEPIQSLTLLSKLIRMCEICGEGYEDDLKDYNMFFDNDLASLSNNTFSSNFMNYYFDKAKKTGDYMTNLIQDDLLYAPIESIIEKGNQILIPIESMEEDELSSSQSDLLSFFTTECSVQRRESLILITRLDEKGIVSLYTLCQDNFEEIIPDLILNKISEEEIDEILLQLTKYLIANLEDQESEVFATISKEALHDDGQALNVFRILKEHGMTSLPVICEDEFFKERIHEYLRETIPMASIETIIVQMIRKWIDSLSLTSIQLYNLILKHGEVDHHAAMDSFRLLYVNDITCVASLTLDNDEVEKIRSILSQISPLPSIDSILEHLKTALSEKCFFIHLFHLFFNRI